jgi:hypothetical protein
MSDSSGDDLSGLTGFFFYVFIIHPCTAWILRPGRFERKKSIMYAIAFLAGVAAIKSGECTGTFYPNEESPTMRAFGPIYRDTFVCYAREQKCRDTNFSCPRS